MTPRLEEPSWIATAEIVEQAGIPYLTEPEKGGCSYWRRSQAFVAPAARFASIVTVPHRDRGQRLLGSGMTVQGH
jgi:hypothetical protein